MGLTHGALFNGIAGFPLSAAWAGIPTKWTVEIDEFCNKVSKKHFPEAKQYTDIYECKNLPYVDIISGGFPCQPFSVAGKQRGKNDDRYLWPEMLRIIQEVKPKYVVGENVTGLIHLGLDDVLTSLEIEGYTTETFNIPACSLGAPHKRERLWIVAYANSYADRDIRKQDRKENGLPGIHRTEVCTRQSFRADTRDVANGSSQGLPERVSTGFGSISKTPTAQQGSKSTRTFTKANWSEFPTQSPLCSGNDGVPPGLVRNRAKQLKAYGNAIVPQVAFEIFKAILELEKNILKK